MNKTLLLTSSLAVLGMSQSAFAGEEVAPIVATAAPASCIWSLGVEALYLKAHSNDDEFGDQDNEFGYRIGVMLKSGDDLGIRVRYFEWEGTEKESGDQYSDLTSFDLEVVGDAKLGEFIGTYSLGLRHLDYQELDGSSTDVDFQAWGPTVGLELIRPLNDTLSFYVNARVSMVFGDDDENNDDSSSVITELGLGLQYDFAMGACGGNIRLGVEAQNYSEVIDGDEEDLGLFGAVLGVNFNF